MECRICGQDAPADQEIILARDRFSGTPEKFPYFECGSCGCVQMVDLPSTTSNFYPPSYYSFGEVRTGGLRFRIKRARGRYALFGRGASGRVLNWVCPDLVLNAVGSVRPRTDDAILDVGCGSGQLLWTLRDLGFRNLRGVDPYLSEEISRDGMLITRQSIEELETPFDLIMFHHSFEHLRDPVESLQHARRIISAEGHVLIRMPTTSSWAWTRFGSHWVQLDAPRHTFIQSLKSMDIIAGQAGFDIVSVEYDSTDFQFWGSAAYEKGLRLVDVHPALLHRAIFLRKARLWNKLQIGDQACWVLRPQKRV